MESKSKKSKKNKTVDIQQVGTHIANDNKTDTVANREECLQVDGDSQMEKEQKKKKKKEKSKSSEGIHIDAASTQETVTANLREEDKSKRKNKENDRHGETSINRMYDEIHEKCSLEVDGEVQKEKEPKKKKLKLNTNNEEIVSEMRDGEESTENKKTARGEKDNKGRESKGEEKIEDGKVGESMAFSEEGNVEKVEKKKKRRKREKQKENDNMGTGLQESMTEDYGKEGSVLPEKNLGDRETDGQSTLRQTIGSEDKEGSEGKDETKATADGSEDPQPKRKSKKVSFSDVEVFPSIVRGKRFSKEEDEIVKESVLNYIKAHGLGDESVNMVMHCKSHPEIKNCWKEIGAALHYRPPSAIYYRAHNLFERADTHKWTEEDYEMVKNAQKKHGNDWKSVAEELGRHRVHVKDAWRRIKFENRKKGQWSQEEYQKLYDLVNMDLQMKVHAVEKKSKHGMLKDDIPWSAISERLSTRIDANCCIKWYKQLTSSMVEKGFWANVDDYRLVGALYDMDASCEGDVDWDNLLEHRSGDVCKQRWNQMVLHIGYHGSKPFAEQVEILAQRYCPDLAHTREAWDSLPVVP